jgi:hypothetical protein
MSRLMKEGNVNRARIVHGYMKKIKECVGDGGMDGRKMLLDRMDHRK